MRWVQWPVCLTILASGGLWADFSYEQTTRVTGGILSGAMKVVGVFSKQATQPVKTSVMIKGNRMAHATADSIQVIDLDKETITDINLKNKTYSVLTFAQMAQAMEQLSKKAAQQTGGNVEANFKASIKETGESKQIGGLNARQVILLLTMEGKNQKTGDKGAIEVKSDMWIARDVAGYEEVRSFYQRMAQKLAWMPGSNAMAQGRSDMAKAFSDLAKESAKLDGVPVLQITAMGADLENYQSQAAEPQAQPQQKKESSSVGGTLGRLGGLGGLGGFGRRRQEPPKEEPQPQQAPAQASGVLMEMTTETAGFSTAPIDASRFEVPSGFRQVESELLKSLR